MTYQRREEEGGDAGWNLRVGTCGCKVPSCERHCTIEGEDGQVGVRVSERGGEDSRPADFCFRDKYDSIPTENLPLSEPSRSSASPCWTSTCSSPGDASEHSVRIPNRPSVTLYEYSPPHRPFECWTWRTSPSLPLLLPFSAGVWTNAISPITRSDKRRVPTPSTFHSGKLTRPQVRKGVLSTLRPPSQTSSTCGRRGGCGRWKRSVWPYRVEDEGEAEDGAWRGGQTAR